MTLARSNTSLNCRIATVLNDGDDHKLKAKLKTLDTLKKESVQMMNYEIRQMHTADDILPDGMMRVHTRFRGLTRKVYVQSLSYKLMEEKLMKKRHSIESTSALSTPLLPFEKGELVQRVSPSQQYYAAYSLYSLKLPKPETNDVKTKKKKKKRNGLR